jgi:hypothetical protein
MCHSILDILHVIAILVSSYAENLGSASDAVKDARVVDGNILLRDKLYHFLRDHATGQCGNVMQLST